VHGAQQAAALFEPDRPWASRAAHADARPLMLSNTRAQHLTHAAQSTCVDYYLARHTLVDILWPC
jgi:hypothetical protein